VPDVVVIGHTDRVGSDPVNDALARRRAETVRAALIRRGIAPENIVPWGAASVSRPLPRRRGRAAQPSRRNPRALIAARRRRRSDARAQVAAGQSASSVPAVPAKRQHREIVRRLDPATKASRKAAVDNRARRLGVPKPYGTSRALIPVGSPAGLCACHPSLIRHSSSPGASIARAS
jgi:hypothetical protein